MGITKSDIKGKINELVGPSAVEMIFEHPDCGAPIEECPGCHYRKLIRELAEERPTELMKLLEEMTPVFKGINERRQSLQARLDILRDEDEIIQRDMDECEVTMHEKLKALQASPLPN